MAVHNGADHLRDAIDSVLGQTFTDFELLVVDDASTDNSVAIVEGYHDPRIRVLRNDSNLNQVISLNRGLAEARGELVARLDHDDRCLPERLARQVAVLDARPDVGLVGCVMDVRDDGDRFQGTIGRPLESRAQLLYRLLSDEVVVGHPSAMFRRSLALELGGYDVDLRWAEDKDLWLRMTLAGARVVVLEEPLVLYRYHPGQQSSTARERQREAARRAVERLTGALAGAEHAQAARACLGRYSGDLWESGLASRAPAALDALLDGAAARLSLTPEERREFEALVGDHVSRATLCAWKTGVAAQRRESVPLRRWAAARGLARFNLLYAAATATAPALYALRGRRVRLTVAFHESPRTRVLKSVGRRSRRLTALYRRVVSDR